MSSKYDMKLKYLNKRFQCNDGEWFTVIDYINGQNITIQFDDGTKMFNKQSGAINRGTIKNPNHNKLSNSLIPTFYGIGFMGIGKYTSSIIYFEIWRSMLARCYSKNSLIKPTYIGCSVIEIWHNFQNFCLWCEENYVEGFALDKDILIKGNKIYGPDTCCFVPQEINNLFIKSNIKRGKYPIGIYLDNENSNKFVARIKINGKAKYLGSFDTIQKTFDCYKEAKEIYIKEMADKWKNKITEKVYQVLYSYQVEITD